MHEFESNPRLMSVQDADKLSRREFLKFAAKCSIGAAAGASLVNYLIGSRPTEEIEKHIPFRIAPECRIYFEKLREQRVPEILRAGMAGTIQTESKFNHYARGKHGDFGYFQMTEIKLEETIENALIGRGSAIERMAARIIRSQLRDISKGLLSSYNIPKSRKREISRDKVVFSAKKRMISNRGADFYVGAGAWLYCSEYARRLCEENRVPYSNDVTDALWNAPARTILALRTDKDDWRKSRFLPTVTKSRRFPRYQLQGQC